MSYFHILSVTYIFNNVVSYTVSEEKSLEVCYVQKIINKTDFSITEHPKVFHTLTPNIAVFCQNNKVKIKANLY